MLQIFDTLQPVSPVRDELDELSRFEIGRIDIDGLLKDDSSLEVKVKLQSVSLDDIRENSNLAVKRWVYKTDKIRLKKCNQLSSFYSFCQGFYP